MYKSGRAPLTELTLDQGNPANLTHILPQSFIKIFALQAAESQKTSPDVEGNTINAFDSQSPVFVAVVVALSLFLFVVLIGGKLCFFITKQLNKRRNTGLMINREDSAPAGNGSKTSKLPFFC